MQKMTLECIRTNRDNSAEDVSVDLDMYLVPAEIMDRIKQRVREKWPRHMHALRPDGARLDHVQVVIKFPLFQ